MHRRILLAFITLALSLSHVWAQNSVGGPRKQKSITTPKSTTTPEPERNTTTSWRSLNEISIPFPSLLALELRAMAILSVSTTGAQGVLFFDQEDDESPVTITGRVTGLSTNGAHGIHIHKFGDLSNGCFSTGSHFNPDNLVHGGPSDTFRHAGDLGNIDADENGAAEVDKSDSGISLTGIRSIIGRSVVIHERQDDLGQGNNTDTFFTGNAGARIACGVIALTQPKEVL